MNFLFFSPFIFIVSHFIFISFLFFFFAFLLFFLCNVYFKINNLVSLQSAFHCASCQVEVKDDNGNNNNSNEDKEEYEGGMLMRITRLLGRVFEY